MEQAVAFIVQSGRFGKTHQQTLGDWGRNLYRVWPKTFDLRWIQKLFEQLLFLPIKLIRKNSDSLLKNKALFGMAGFLIRPGDVGTINRWSRNLNFCSINSFASYKLNKAQWRFLRLRPANFPTIRIAQFARRCINPQLFFWILSLDDIQFVKKNLPLMFSAYWQTLFFYKSLMAKYDDSPW